MKNAEESETSIHAASIAALKNRTSANPPQVSVIVPAYNVERDIATCLDSILAQKDVSLEIIVVENGSEDGTREIIQTYARAHSEIKPIYLDRNCGPAGARNPALDQARGKFIAFCDSDDQVPEGAYAELVRVAEAESADIVTGNYSRKYPLEGNAIRQFSHYQMPTGFERCFEAGNTTLWNKLFRRSFIEKHHLRFDTSLLYHEDFLFYLRFMINEPVAAFTDNSVYIYTDPSMRTDINDAECIRYAHLDVVKSSLYALRDVFRQPIRVHADSWARCLYDQVNWLLQCVWCNIMDMDKRKAGFEAIREALCALQENPAVCAWSTPTNAQRFTNAVGIDICTFASISCEDYLFLWARWQNIRCREADPAVREQLNNLTFPQRDNFLNDNIQNILGDIRETYQTGFQSGSKIWRQNYWNLVDTMVNDYWRPMISGPLKERRFDEIRSFLTEMSQSNRICKLENEQVIFRFKEIFGVDLATLQLFSLSQYLLLCEMNNWTVESGKSAIQVGETERPAMHVDIADPLTAFVAACRNGQVGLRGILRSLNAWFRYKCRRRRA